MGADVAAAHRRAPLSGSTPAPAWAGLLLAAGAGRRFGRPKALVDLVGEPAVVTQVRRLEESGAASVTVVLGAAADEVRPLLAPYPGLDVVVADDWDEGMGASLRAGLTRLADAPSEVDAVLVTLVDLPDVTESVITRVVAAWAARGARRDDLLRASYDGRPGHPVLLGRDHVAALAASSSGDVGARDYLAERKVHKVSCEDLATGRDVDRPQDLPGDRS